MKIKDLLKEINPVYLDDLQVLGHHSHFIQENDYKIIIIRGLEVSIEGLTYSSKGIVISHNSEVFYYDHEGENLVRYQDGYKKLFELISPIYTRNQKIIDSYINEIDSLEDNLFERKISAVFMDIWFDLKKDLTRVERHFQRNYGILDSFVQANLSDENFQGAEFKNLLNDINHTQQNTRQQVARLDALYNYYGSIKNDKLNKNIYMMTLLSAVFLPLNLIVGFFGMNTANLFFKDSEMGTQYVFFTLIGSLLISVFGLPIIRFIDHKILKVFLGRYNIYKNISSKVVSILSID